MSQTRQKMLTFQVIDFVTPYFSESGISIIMKKPGRDQQLFKFVTVLESDVWIGIGVVILGTALLLWIFEKCSPFSSRNNSTKDQVKNRSNLMPFEVKHKHKHKLPYCLCLCFCSVLLYKKYH